ncbi:MULTISPECIES: VOC family protein [Hyphomicrobiales]|jgi:catechol 2,3-dioxygenase-like lactoylglutathione lyase family enzyme|uniref:VOC family protein n=1 Tax=Hyphomicrobiales TaxID=356 RepID=UPI00037C42B7|nr:MULTISPECIES: VOC family protein [Phyllobacteriaceae]MCX8572963.1 VOC family protein [Aminobacter sp. MET-1]
MKLNHANLATSDVAALAGFFADHFGFRLDAIRGRDAFAVLTGSDGFALNLMKPGTSDGPYPAGFHVGFFVESPELVRVKQAELAAAGFAPGEIQELTRGGTRSTTFYCNAPGGVLVEVASS